MVGTSIIGVLLTLAIVGFCLWLVITYIPMPPPFKSVILVVVVILVILWLLRAVPLSPAFG